MESVSDLKTSLAIGAREHIALVGGGGKTTLLFSLAEELRRAGKRVLTTTTTKVWHREASRAPQVVFSGRDSEWRMKLGHALEEGKYAFLADNVLDSGKVEGIRPSLADELYLGEMIDYLILEADGAAGHPVKAPAEHEPVIPSSATKVVAVMGLEALGRGMDPAVVFRMDLAARLTGLDPGQRLTPSALSRLFLDPRGLFKGMPPSAERIAFLNKFDLLSDITEARDLAHILLGASEGRTDQVIIGSVKTGSYHRVRGIS